MPHQLPGGFIAYGPDTNCTVELCPVEWSILGYEPSLGANAAFVVLFAIAAVVHTVERPLWKKWRFTVCMILGCLDET